MQTPRIQPGTEGKSSDEKKRKKGEVQEHIMSERGDGCGILYMGSKRMIGSVCSRRRSYMLQCHIANHLVGVGASHVWRAEFDRELVAIGIVHHRRRARLARVVCMWHSVRSGVGATMTLSVGPPAPIASGCSYLT